MSLSCQLHMPLSIPQLLTTLTCSWCPNLRPQLRRIPSLQPLWFLHRPPNSMVCRALCFPYLTSLASVSPTWYHGMLQSPGERDCDLTPNRVRVLQLRYRQAEGSTEQRNPGEWQWGGLIWIYPQGLPLLLPPSLHTWLHVSFVAPL